MNPITAFIASSGLCASRAFTPALLAALFLRFGAEYDVFQGTAKDLIGSSTVATWFTSNLCIGVLAVLAALEFAANRIQEAREALAYVDKWAKPVMAGAMTLGLLAAQDAAFAEEVLPEQAGIGDSIIAATAAAFNYSIVSVRNGVQQLLFDVDPDNSTGLHTVLSWSEDGVVVFGMIALLFFPILVCGLIVVGIGLLWALRAWAQRRENAARVPCGSCAAAMFRSAVRCGSCRAPNPAPMAVNWLGVASTNPAPVEGHPEELLSKRRCPCCAARLEGHDVARACSACNTPPFESMEAVARFDSAMQARLPRTLAFGLLMGLVPVLGMIAGVLYFRTRVVAPYRQYVSGFRRFLLRLVLRILIVALVLFQLIPLLGSLAIPLLALVNHRIFRRAFLAQAGQRLSVAAAGPSSTPDIATA